PAQRIWRGAVGRVRTARRLLLTLDSPRDKLARQESGRTSMRALSLALSVAMIAAMPSSQAASYFTVTSKSIKDGARIPARFAADDPKRPCRPGSTEICPCPGQNVSPQLAWTNAPAGTRSFAILMYDVDGQMGAGVSHWVAYNIAPTVHELAEGDGSAGKNFTGGRGSPGQAPHPRACPPPGHGQPPRPNTLVPPDRRPTPAARPT